MASPAEVARRLNTLYPMESNDRHYFTMIYGVLDLETGSFRFITAGHPGPILVRPGSPPEQIVVPSLMIGVFQDVNYSDSEVQLAAGDRLYLFSDGLYEETLRSRRRAKDQLAAGDRLYLFSDGLYEETNDKDLSPRKIPSTFYSNDLRKS